MQEKPSSIFHQFRKKGRVNLRGLLIKVERCTTEKCRGSAKQRKLGVVHLGVLEFGGQALNKAGSLKEGINPREKLKIKRQKKVVKQGKRIKCSESKAEKHSIKSWEESNVTFSCQVAIICPCN